MESELDKFFSDLSELNKVEEIKEETCCEQTANQQLGEGVVVCKICNNVVTNIIDGPEWRYYGSGDSKITNPTRCGMPTNELLPKSSMGTTISTRGGGGNMHRVRRFQKWNGIPYKERSLLKVFQDITDKCNKAGLPSIIIKEAHSLYNVIATNKISRGGNRIGLIAACVYFACIDCKVGRSVNEIADIFSIKNTLLTKGCKTFKEIMYKNKNMNRVNTYKTVGVEDFLHRFCSKLGLSGEDIEKINLIAIACKNKDLVCENTPPSMAAGCIYLYLKNKNIPHDKKELAEVCKISEVTINKCFKKLEKSLDINEILK
jgi:transcription initiation factor TFIIB